MPVRDTASMNISISSSDIADTIRKFGYGSISNFSLNEFRDVERWSGSIDGRLLARSLSSIIDCNSPKALVEACAKAIAAVDEWQQLVGELLLNGDVSSALIDVVRQVYSCRKPDHVLVNTHYQPKHAFLVCDATNDGKVVQFYTDNIIANSNECLIMDLGNPTDLSVRVNAKQIQNKIIIPLEKLFWFTPARLVCPAFIFIT